MELFVRSGPSIPAEGPIFSKVLATGWYAEGGARSLFFNPNMDKAWAITLGISDQYNHNSRQDLTFPMTFPVPTGINPVTQQPTGFADQTRQVTIRDLNRTCVNFSLGREWYLFRPANAADFRWRVGADVGGRIGSVKIQYLELQHLTDVLGGIFLSGHSDWELPCGACTFIAGFRAEWGYNWMDVMQTSNSNLQDVNLLMNFGVRF
jgi:hypothetical protein